MDYINAQLQAHGLARRPLSVSSLSSSDQEQLSKCLSALLQQRTVRVFPSLSISSTRHLTDLQHFDLVWWCGWILMETVDGIPG